MQPAHSAQQEQFNQCVLHKPHELPIFQDKLHLWDTITATQQVCYIIVPANQESCYESTIQR